MRTFYCGVVVMLACASNGTDTGNPVNVEPVEIPTPPEDCLERPRDITRDEVTPLGVTGAQVIALVQGEHRHSLGWSTGELDAGHYIQFGPESGESEVLLTVEPSGGLRYIERDPRPYPGPQRNPSVCEDVIEVDVELGVSTTGGALNEQVATHVRAMSADIAYAEVVFGMTLGGSFTAASFYEGFVTAGPASLRLDFTLTSHGNMATLSTTQEMVAVSEPERKLTYTQGIAGFAGGGDCPAGIVVPLDASVRGASAGASMALLNASSPGILTADDSLLTYSVTTVGQPGCLQFSPISPSDVVIEMPARLSLSAPQANIEGDVDVTLHFLSQQGALLHAGVSADIVSQDPAAFTALASQFAVTAPLDFTGYLGATFRLDAHAFASSGSSGSLKVTGLAPTCAGPAVECEHREDLFDARWSDEPPSY